jgi:hypothetical protein
MIESCSSEPNGLWLIFTNPASTLFRSSAYRLSFLFESLAKAISLLIVESYCREPTVLTYLSDGVPGLSNGDPALRVVSHNFVCLSTSIPTRMVSQSYHFIWLSLTGEPNVSSRGVLELSKYASSTTCDTFRLLVRFHFKLDGQSKSLNFVQLRLAEAILILQDVSSVPVTLSSLNCEREE